jgi:hypothetical protein
MPYLVGAVLALVVGGFGSLVRLDRDRAFYATILIVVGVFYILFAVMGGTALAIEAAAFTAFLVMSVVGFRGSLWWVVVGLAGHGIFDGFHGQLISNPGVPAWWPAFCGTYDVVAAGYLAALLLRKVVPVHSK